MFEKKEVYLIYGPNAVSEPKIFANWTKNLEEEGIRPVSYVVETMNEAETGAFIQDVVLVRVKEKWHGAFKRFAKKYSKENLGRRYNDLEIWG